MKVRICSLIVLVCLTISLPAWAQDIVELNEQGIEAFQEGRFADAASAFRQAYEKEPQPPLKKNEAAAWFKAGKCDDAMGAAKEYLALDTGAELSIKEAQAIMVDCNLNKAKTALEAGQFDEATGYLDAADAHMPDEDAELEIASVRASVVEKKSQLEEEKKRAAAEAEAKRQAELDAQRRSRMQTVGLGVAGGGAAIVLGTLVYHSIMAFGVAPKFKDVAAAGDDRGEYDRLGKRLETANWLIPTLYAVGLATGGVGAYLWMSNGSLESNPQQASAREIGVQVVWRF